MPVRPRPKKTDFIARRENTFSAVGSRGFSDLRRVVRQKGKTNEPRKPLADARRAGKAAAGYSVFEENSRDSKTINLVSGREREERETTGWGGRGGKSVDK